MMQPKLLTFDDRKWIEKKLELFSPSFSEMSFSNLIAYLPSRPIHVAIHEETLLFLLPEGKSWQLFGEPIGPLTSDEAILKLNLTGATRTSAPKNRIEGFEVISLPEHADYILKREAIASLEGHEYHRKRQLVEGCIDRYHPLFLPLEEKQIEGCLLLNDSQQGDDEEKRAVATLLHHFSSLPLFGAVVIIENQLEAFIIGEKLNPNSVNIHAMKSSHTIHGLVPYLLHSFAKILPSLYTCLNMQQDLGSEGLRTSKERWRPDRMTIKYAIRRRAQLS